MDRVCPPVRATLVAGLLLVGWSLSGCAHTAEVSCWQPADIELDGVERLTILDFSGEAGPQVARAVARRLEGSPYTIVDRPTGAQEIRTASFDNVAAADLATPRTTLEADLEAAQQTGVDAAVVGEIVAYRCEDLSAHEASTASWKSGGTSDSESAVNESAVRQAEVSVTFHVMDVRTGEVLSTRTVTRTYEQPVTTALRGRTKVLDGLVEECVEEFVLALAPQQAPVQMELADCDWFHQGCRSLRRGNKLAREGHWIEAEAAWMQVLEADPENDAAMFNLAVAAVERSEFEEAEDFAMQAIRRRPSECYIKGLDLIRRHQREFEKSQEHYPTPIITASAAGG